MKKLSYDIVRTFFKDNNCELLSKEYINSKTKLIYKCKCGHIRESTLSHVKLWKQFNCKKCTMENSSMHPKTFKKILRLMENKYKKSLKYRNDFLPENYDKKLKCWDCGKVKNFKLFPYRKQYKDNKEKRCKNCNKLDNEKRRNNQTIEQRINELLNSCKASAQKRLKNGRKNCGIMTLTINDILELKKKQNNKCIYTGQELNWKQNTINKASIDRIDSNKGYVKNNIQLVAHLINQAKSDLKHNEFLLLIKQIYEYNNLGKIEF